MAYGATQERQPDLPHSGVLSVTASAKPGRNAHLHKFLHDMHTRFEVDGQSPSAQKAEIAGQVVQMNEQPQLYANAAAIEGSHSDRAVAGAINAASRAAQVPGATQNTVDAKTVTVANNIDNKPRGRNPSPGLSFDGLT